MMNGFARKVWTSFDEVVGMRKVTNIYKPQQRDDLTRLYDGWLKAVYKVCSPDSRMLKDAESVTVQ